MDEYIEAIVVGIVQGLTEFLPVCVVGAPHRAAARSWAGTTRSSTAPTFVVMLHMGTLAALLAYFWRDVLELLRAGWAALRERSLAGDPAAPAGGGAARRASSRLRSLASCSRNGSSRFFRETDRSSPVILAVGAGILWLAERFGARDRDLEPR